MFKSAYYTNYTPGLIKSLHFCNRLGKGKGGKAETEQEEKARKAKLKAAGLLSDSEESVYEYVGNCFISALFSYFIYCYIYIYI